MSKLRLGVSGDILPYTTQQILDSDYRFNKFLINTVQSAVKGAGIGLFLSLFFIKKQRIVFYGSGFGAGLSFFHEFR
jgi:hypothetical protein